MEELKLINMSLSKGLELYWSYKRDQKSRSRWWKRVEKDLLTYVQLLGIGKSNYPHTWLMNKFWSPKEYIKEKPVENETRLKLRRVRLENFMNIVSGFEGLSYVNDVIEKVKLRSESQITHFAVWAVYAGKKSLDILNYLENNWHDCLLSDTGSLFDLLSYVGVAAKKWPEYFERRGLEPMAMVDMKNLLGWILNPSEIDFDFVGKAMSLMTKPVKPEIPEFWDYFKNAVDSLIGQVRPNIRAKRLSLDEWWEAGKAGTSGSARGVKVVVDGKWERISKNGLVGIWTAKRMREAIEAGFNTVVPVWKQDRGKGRVIWSSDSESTVGLGYVRYYLGDPELSIRGYALGLKPSSKLRLTSSMMDKNIWRMPLDIDSFDSHFTQDIRNIIQSSMEKYWIAPNQNEDLQYAWNNYKRRMSMVTVLVQSDENDPTRPQWLKEIYKARSEGHVQNIEVTKKNIQFTSQNGLFSGQVDTSLMGTIFTLASQIATYNYMIDKYGITTQLTEVAAGDDTELTFADYESAVLYYYAVQAMGLRVNPTKFWIDMDRTEFLRVNIAEVARGYIARGVGSMVERQPGKTTELTQEEKFQAIVDAVRLCTIRKTTPMDMMKFNNRLLRLMGSILGVNKLFNVSTTLGGVGVASEFVNLKISGRQISREPPVFKQSEFIAENAVKDAMRIRSKLELDVGIENWVKQYMDNVYESIDNSDLSRKLAEDYKSKFVENDEKRHVSRVIVDGEVMMNMMTSVDRFLKVMENMDTKSKLETVLNNYGSVANSITINEDIMFIKSLDTWSQTEKTEWLMSRYPSYVPNTCRSPTEIWDYLVDGVGLLDHVGYWFNADLNVVLKKWFINVTEQRWMFSKASFETMIVTYNCVWLAIVPKLHRLFNNINY
jgi:hypothetical protein